MLPVSMPGRWQPLSHRELHKVKRRRRQAFHRGIDCALPIGAREGRQRKWAGTP
jgi:hypothetical protein